MPTTKRNGKHVSSIGARFELTSAFQEENWYKPQPGEPYRPLIAMPSQLIQKIPGFSYCGGTLFTAFDPPSALKVATALAPPLPPSNPISHPWAPAPSPTIDPGAGHTLRADASTAVPAKVPTVDQPEATNAAAPTPPKPEGPNPKPQPDNPANQESSQSQPNKVDPNSNTQEGNDPQQSSDPHQGSSPEQGSGSSGNSGQEADPKPNSDSSQVESNQGSDPNSNPQDNPKQTDDVNPQMVTTIGGQAITAAPGAVVIAGNSLTLGAPGATIDGTILSLNSAGQFVVGSKTIHFGSKFPETMTTNIAGQVITAAPNAVAVAGTTLTPGAPGITLDGTLLSLATAGELIVGSKTVPLGSASPNSIVTTIGGQVITATPNKIAIRSTALTPGAPGITVGGTLVSLNTAGQLLVGSKTIALPNGSTGLRAPTEVADLITTTIDGQVITAGPTALVMAGTTLTSGAPGFTIDGTLVSLDTAAQLVIGSKTISFQNENGVSSGQTIGLGGLIMGGFGNGGLFGSFGTNSPSPAEGNVSTGGRNSTNTSVQAFQGNTARLQGNFLWKSIAMVALLMCILTYLC